MKLDLDKIALHRSAPADYKQVLMLWYEFMREAERPEYDLDGEWDPCTDGLRPSTEEKDAESWLRARAAGFEFVPEFPIWVHESRSDAVNYWTDDPSELHVTLHLNYPPAELRDALERILRHHGVVGKSGPRKGVYGVAEFQPNDSYDVQVLNRYLTAIQHRGSGADSMLQHGKENLGMHHDERNDNSDSIIRQVYDLRKRARDIVRGVRKGRFPNANRSLFGEPIQEG